MNNHTSQTLEIPLTRGYVATIDLVDVDLAEFSWYATSEKGRGKYAIRNSSYAENPKRKTIQMHKVIMGRVLGRDLLPKEKVDHVDGNGFNNVRSNLRLATQSQNSQNRKIRKDNKTGFKGVTYHKNSKLKNKFQAFIFVDGKRKSLGYYATPELAHEAYKKGATKHFGEFARFE